MQTTAQLWEDTVSQQINIFFIFIKSEKMSKMGKNCKNQNGERLISSHLWGAVEYIPLIPMRQQQLAISSILKLCLMFTVDVIGLMPRPHATPTCHTLIPHPYHALF